MVFLKGGEGSSSFLYGRGVLRSLYCSLTLSLFFMTGMELVRTLRDMDRKLGLSGPALLEVLDVLIEDYNQAKLVNNNQEVAQ